MSTAWGIRQGNLVYRVPVARQKAWVTVPMWLTEGLEIQDKLVSANSKVVNIHLPKKREKTNTQTTVELRLSFHLLLNLKFMNAIF